MHLSEQENVASSIISQVGLTKQNSAKLEHFSSHVIQPSLPLTIRAAVDCLFALSALEKALLDLRTTPATRFAAQHNRVVKLVLIEVRTLAFRENVDVAPC